MRTEERAAGIRLRMTGRYAECASEEEEEERGPLNRFRGKCLNVETGFLSVYYDDISVTFTVDQNTYLETF